MENDLFQHIIDGRTDLVFDYLADGHDAASGDQQGRPLIRWCAYHGDVSAIRHLLASYSLRNKHWRRPSIVADLIRRKSASLHRRGSPMNEFVETPN